MLALGLLLWTAPGAGAATRNDIACGASITQSVVLTHDLVCPGTAFSFSSGARFPAVTVDLGRHTVSSIGSPTISVEGGPAFTLQNGRIIGPVLQLTGGPDVYQNLVFGSGGIVLAAANYLTTIRQNRFINGASIRTDEATVDIAGNRFVNGPRDKVAISLKITWATVAGNTITGYGKGIEIGDAPSTADFQHNVVAHSGTGIQIGGGAGDAVPGIVRGNWVVGNTADGILLGNGSGHQAANLAGGISSGLVTSNNVALFNGGDGIRIDPTAHTVPPAFPPIDGISITVTRNLAVRNANLGIESPGDIPPDVTVTDGGGNVAMFNGNPAQCINIICGGLIDALSKANYEAARSAFERLRHD